MNSLPDNIETQGSSLRLRCPYFRILVMGRSNAGKTTILKKVCNSVDDPLIFDRRGRRIDPFVVAPSAERGYHDINNEMIFKSNRDFIFHDSRGFECGSVDETETVKKFLTKRAKARELKDQLHAVWYCLPTDTARPILAADETFFNGCGIGKAPVIVIFTKFDGLVTMACSELRSHLSFREALKQAPAAAVIKLDALFKKPLQASKFPPAACLYLRDMQRAGTTCAELIEATAGAITDDALKGLFLSVQQSNVELCSRHVLESIASHFVYQRDLSLQEVTTYALSSFPHVWRNEEYDTPDSRYRSSRSDRIFQKNCDSITALLRAKATSFDSLHSGHKNEHFMLNALTAVLLCMEQTFAQASVWGDGLPKAFSAALDVYVASGRIITVQGAITTIFSGRATLLRLKGELMHKVIALIMENQLRL